MKKVVLLLLLLSTTNLFGQSTKKKVLLVGTFHFNNPGADVVKVKTFDVMSAKSQQELDLITDKIKNYNPDKIFVEWEHDDQAGLDSLYDLYVRNKYSDYVNKKFPKSNFYKQNEIFQLAFKAARKLGLKKVHAIDYPNNDFPYDSLMAGINDAKQTELKMNIDKALKEYTATANADIQKMSLTQLLLKMNQTKARRDDLGTYISEFNRGGAADNFVGAYLVSEWYKRNLYMYALLQKITESKDKKIMVLLGASHVAMFKEFIALDKNFEAVELEEVLK